MRNLRSSQIMKQDVESPTNKFLEKLKEQLESNFVEKTRANH